jgi:multisubunit Na+/H+ antiporter MnhB subunit
MTRRSLILDVTVRTIFDSAIVLSLYLLFAGHNQPGGGFVGGLVAGAALGLRFVAGGAAEVARTLRLRPATLVAAGLLLAAATAAAPMAVGDPVLSQPLASADLPLFGPVKATGALPFDVGVFLVVVGMVGMVLDAVGPDLQDSDEDRETTR